MEKAAADTRHSDGDGANWKSWTKETIVPRWALQCEWGRVEHLQEEESP